MPPRDIRELSLGVVAIGAGGLEGGQGLLALVGVAEVFFGSDLVSDELFEFFDVGEAALCRARPEELVVYVDLEDSACARTKGNFADFRDEGREKFLGHPGGAEHPIALGAVGDTDRWLGGLIG